MNGEQTKRLTRLVAETWSITKILPRAYALTLCRGCICVKLALGRSYEDGNGAKKQYQKDNTRKHKRVSCCERPE